MELLTQDQPVASGVTANATFGTGASTPWAAATIVFKAGTTGATTSAASTMTKNPQGAQTGLSYALPGSHTLTDTATLSQAGRVMTDTAVRDGGTVSAWSYAYDTVARLTQAVLAANGATSAVTYGYNYAATGGCGADPAAGLDGARSSSTVQVGTGTVNTTTSCTDYAGRLTSATGANPTTAVYNSHGDATTIGTQTFTYDSSDRVTSGSSTSGGVTQNLTYTLDMGGRLLTRTASGTGAGVDTSTTNYSLPVAVIPPICSSRARARSGNGTLPYLVVFFTRSGMPILVVISGRSLTCTAIPSAPPTRAGRSPEHPRFTTRSVTR